MGDRPSLTDIIDDLRAEQRDLRRVVDEVELEAETPAEGWTVRDTISHLAGFDVEATKAATTPQLFLHGLGEVVADIDAFMAAMSASRRDLPRADLVAGWEESFAAMTSALVDLEPGTKVPWYGPPMSPASFATARLMEYWAHGQDVVDVAGVRREPTSRLRHICHLGVRTRGFSYVNRGRQPPTADVRVELTAPDGATWAFGDPAAPDRVTGSAEEFCLLVTQRRSRHDLALTATGALADEWLDIAQCFAGPPGPGRQPRQRA